MDRKVIITAILFSMLSVVFSMSGDGENVPVVQKKEAVKTKTQENVPVEQKEIITQSIKSNTIETVKDRLGVDTGMTKEHFQVFETNYLKKCEELGVQKYPRISPKSYFEHKINLNAVEKLKSNGLFLTKNPFLPEENFAYNITHSDVIILGEIDSISFFYNTREDELNAVGNVRSRYFVRIDKILKGDESMELSSDKVTFISSIGKYIISSGEYQMKLKYKYIFFFSFNSLDEKEFKNDLSKHNGSLRIENGKTFIEYFKDEFKSYNEVLTMINKFIEVNDIANFYNRNYISKENKNEK